ncbi:lmgt2 [Strigomonas culicis]|uniref:Lmgt2 n=1 Tax=Strigomonas culicis TaxID=28005 RepID=S9TRZ6_9TRYP|nr:lmgt2 [Strigomonas culicis]|eukprot:EPY19283.1 lmgt2 [Strigomonas culicis]
MIVGCFFGSFVGGPLSRLIGPKLVFLLVGIAGVICSVMYHISVALDLFWVLCVFRLVIGVFLGVCCVAAPMYVAENAHPKYAKMIGVMFQVFTTFGIFLAATMGLAMGQSIKYDAPSSQNLIGRLQGLCVLSTLLSLLVMAMGIYLPGSLRQKRAQPTEPVGEDEQERELPTDEKTYSCVQMIGPLLMGFIVAGTLQLTGINAIMNYAPTIMQSLGLAPLVGNFVVMVWNFVTTIFSIPLASVFTMRQLFLACSLITSVMCLLMCGIPVFPGITHKTEAKNGVAITGILIFIGAFEMGVGPCFYVLAQDLFPKSFRPTGASATNVAQFVFNVIINVCYPIATEALSGGASGNQDKGQAIAFIFFGCIGLVCFVFQCLFLKPWDETHKVTASAPEVERHSEPDYARKEEKMATQADIHAAVAKNRD